MKPRQIISLLGNIAALILFIYLLVFPQYASEPTREALAFCGNTLIPSLFIYMILSKTLMNLPVTHILAKKLGYEAVLLPLGALCGAPIGAKNAVSLYESGRISKKHAEFLCSFTNNASLSFVIGYVGKELFGSVKIGLMLFFCQTAASVLTAFVMKRLMFGGEKPPRQGTPLIQKTGLRDAVADSALTMLNLCACAIFFIVAGGAISRIFSLGTVPDAILKSALEFSSGCAAAAKTGRFALPITAFSIGLTGFSVALQVQSVIAGRLSIRPYLAGKLISCTAMVILTVICG